MKLLVKTPFISIICALCAASSFATSNKIKVTKFDTENKGIADLILFEKPDATVSIKLNGTKIIRYEVNRTYRGASASVKYSLKNDSLSIVYGFATSSRYFYNEDACAKNKDSDPLSQLASLFGATKTQSIQYDTSCKSQPGLQKQISNNFNDFLKNKKSMAECISNYSMIASQKWLSLPNSLTKISCDDSSVKYNGVFDSKTNQIRISSKCSRDLKELTSVLKEEMLHSFSVTDEKLAKCLSQCPSMLSSKACEEVNVQTKKKQTNGSLKYMNLVMTSPDGTISQNTADDYNSAKTIEVPKEIAVAQVPQPSVQDLRMTQSVETSTVTDTSSAAAGSQGSSESGSGASGTVGSSGGGRSYSPSAYPNSMMQFAVTAVLPEKAFARATSPTNNTTTSPRSSDSSSSLHSPPTSSSEAFRHAAASRMPASNSVLTNPSYSASANPSSGNSDKSADGPGASKEIGKSSSAKALHSTGGRIGRAGGAPSSASDGNGNPGAISNGGGPNGSAGNSSSTVGARSPTSVRNFATNTPTNLVQYFQSAPYREIKQRLRDPKFIQDLKKNSTTVFDTQGHQFGAEQGQIIYSDKGNRFVKEK